MPTSDVSSIPAIVSEICRLQPKSVLDLGTGLGKYPVLIREYLDGVNGHTSYDEWTVVIDAVEGFQKYLGPLHLAVCDNVWNEDFSEEPDKYVGYDLVLMIDSLEHLEKTKGEEVLATLRRNNKQVIVSVPWGKNYYEQGPCFGNDFETHRAKWGPNELAKLGGKPLHIGVCAAFSLPGKV